MQCFSAFWPYLTVQNYLPACPLLMLVLAPFAIRPETTRRDSPPGKRSSLSGLPLLLCLASFEVVMSILVATPWQDGTRAQVALLEDVLRLTDAKDHILDLKGETLFRKRSFFYVMEAVTIARMQCGAIVDDIRERLLETQTCVVVPDDELFPPDTRKLLLEHYLPVGNLRVAGRFLTSDESIAPRHLFFEVLIAARYDIVAPVGAVSGLLDGVAYKGPVFSGTGQARVRGLHGRCVGTGLGQGLSIGDSHPSPAVRGTIAKRIPGNSPPVPREEGFPHTPSLNLVAGMRFFTQGTDHSIPMARPRRLPRNDYCGEDRFNSR